MSDLNEIYLFLEKNNFKKIGVNHYGNDKCSIRIIKHTELTDCYYYAVANINGDVIYSDDINIYWLIGVLIWFDYVDEIVK